MRWLLCLYVFLSLGNSFSPPVPSRHQMLTRKIWFSSTVLRPAIDSTGSTESGDDEILPLAESEAVKWARRLTEELNPSQDGKGKKKFVVIGAGWGGWGAAKALCQSGIDSEVIIIDALPDPTGKTPYLSSTGKPVEAGTRGFWKDYPNINALCTELGLEENKVFTEFTNSSFYSPDGLEATAPVFSTATWPELPNLPFLSSLSGQKIPQLPSPLGQVMATFPLFERIPLIDRASMVGLLVATVDCLGGDESVQEMYDRMTAQELFIRFNLSPRLVEDFIKPTLLVGLFKPPEELSALVVMELLYYYALAHMDSFDVRWIRNGTVSDSLIAPMATKLQSDYGLKVLGGCRVGRVDVVRDGSESRANRLEYQSPDGSIKAIDDIDGIVLALTCRGMESVISKSPKLAQFPAFSLAASCKGIDVISVRLWLDRIVPTRTPANVFSRFAELRGAGGTFFMLDQLQSDSLDLLWGNSGNESTTTMRKGSVVACDFYNAGALITLPDDELVRILMDDLLPSAVPAFQNAKVLDQWVGRYPGVVSWFAPGTFTKRPPLHGAGREVLPNVKCAGDWVRLGDREHGAKGLCQERAYVTGLEAGNALLRDVLQRRSFRGSIGGGDTSFGVSDNEVSSMVDPRFHPVLPVRDDEAQFRAAVAFNRQVMQYIPRFWVR